MEVITYGGRYAIERNDKKTIEANGFTKFTDSVIARIGLLDYNDASEPNGIRIENRGEIELFSQSHLDSLAGSPLTFIHPNEMVDGINYKEHIVGSIINPRKDGEYLVADIIVYDDDVISKIDAGTVELSEGYSLNELVKNDELGHYEQKGMVANHVAIVPKGRCGGNCKLNFDAKTGLLKSDTISLSNKKERVEMRQFHYDGVDYDLSTPDGAKPLVDLIENLKSHNDSLEVEAKKSLDTLSSAKKELLKKDAEIASLKAKAGDDAINARVDALIKRKECETYLASQGIPNLDAMDDAEIQRTFDSVKLVAGRKIASQLNVDAGQINADSKREQYMKAQKNK